MDACMHGRMDIQVGGWVDNVSQVSQAIAQLDLQWNPPLLDLIKL